MIEQTDSIDERSLSEAIEDSATHCQYCGKRLLTEWGRFSHERHCSGDR